MGELALCAHVVFFSSEWVRRRAAELAGEAAGEAGEAAGETGEAAGETGEAAALGSLPLASLCTLASRLEPRLAADGVGRLWVCAWGAVGAFALELDGGGREVARHFAPGREAVAVLDSTGAGDTFNAACIAALARGAAAGEALRVACAVAGEKVGQDGFGGLGATYRDALLHRTGVVTARPERDGGGAIF